MHRTWQQPLTRREPESPRKGVGSQCHWDRRQGPPRLPPRGGESRPVSPSGPSDDRPIGGQPSPYSRPSSPRSQVGEGGQLEKFNDAGQRLVLGVILESEKHRNKENSLSM